MLIEQPLHRVHAYVQHGSNLRKHQLFGDRSAMEKPKQFPTDNFQAEPISNHINSIFGSPGQNEFREFKNVVGRSFPKMKQKVSAFGPKHAELARRFYWSSGTQPEIRQDLLPTFRQYGRMQVSYIKQTQSNKGADYLEDSVFKRTPNRDSVSRQVPVPTSC